jgi:hypothetical protein
MLITITEQTLNYEAIKIHVRYGFFEFYLDILNVDANSSINQLTSEDSGSFGSVYKVYYKRMAAVKSIELHSEKFQEEFQEAVR